MTNEDYLTSAFLSNFINEGIYITNGHKINASEDESNDTTIKETGTEINENTKLCFSGQNFKKVCVVVDYPHHESIIPKDALILERILASVNLTFEDIALVNQSKSRIQPEDIPYHLETQKLIAFGIKNMKQYNQVEFRKDLKLLYCPDNLSNLAMSKEKKIILWQNLKDMFNI
jgi:hypothetical protein